VCISEALPLDRYAALLEEVGFGINQVEPHPEVLESTVRNVRARLLGAELLVNIKKLELPGVDFEEARMVAASAARTIDEGTLGYGLLVGTLS